MRSYATAVSFMLVLLAIFSANKSSAGGLLGDAVETLCGNCGAGKAMDDANRQVKDAIPPYKAIEEGASRTVNEALVQATAPLLQELIARSRDDALNAGVEQIPPAIRRNLTGFIPEQILNIARYRVKGGGDLTLQVNSIRYGEANAITLDYVIVFKEVNDALYNPALWAHELTHVMQYQNWGIKDFSIRYVRNYRDVEATAYDAGTKYLAWVSVRNAQQWSSTESPNDTVSTDMLNRPRSSFPLDVSSNMCGTPIGNCQVNGSAPVGTPCWCNSTIGGVAGSLVPVAGAGTPQPMQVSNPTGLPSGYGMQACGCWGPTPTVTAAEPRCGSGSVRLNVCPGQCAPGHPPYAYVCQ